MNPDLFLADLEEKPERLRAWKLRGAWGFVTRPQRVVLLGMGSSHYADLVGAARLRAAGVDAVAELASSRPAPRDPARRPRRGRVGVGRLRRDPRRRRAARRQRRRVANQPGPLTERATRTVWMEAGEERGGVACRSYQHTLALLALESHLVGAPLPAHRRRRCGGGPAAHRPTWRPRVAELLLGPHGTQVVAPARRLSSAYQSALMLREGPRLRAYGCETGDWSHVDVYLTKTTDYRMLLLGGSRWEPSSWSGHHSAAPRSSGSVPTPPA